MFVDWRLENRVCTRLVFTIFPSTRSNEIRVNEMMISGAKAKPTFTHTILTHALEWNERQEVEKNETQKELKSAQAIIERVMNELSEKQEAHKQTQSRMSELRQEMKEKEEKCAPYLRTFNEAITATTRNTCIYTYTFTHTHMHVHVYTHSLNHLHEITQLSSLANRHKAIRFPPTTDMFLRTSAFFCLCN
jgi:hypothetical protein